MVRPVPRKTVYAATLITCLALAGGWTLAAGTGTTHGPTQNSNITVTAPGGFTVAKVQSTQIMSVSPALISGLSGPAGTQAAGTGNGLNSSATQNALLTACAGAFCESNYSAVDSTYGLAVGDTTLQVMLTVSQPTTTASGFDVQVEIIYNVTTPTPLLYAFGTGYFDTNTATGAGTAFYAAALYVDLGVPSTSMPSITDIVVTMNNCQTATTCP
jgi:hypothetical protein